jgi:hypothetical protein
LPVAVLGLVDGEPLIYVLVVARDDELGVIEEMVDDTSISPGAILVKQSERCVPMEELLL